MYILNTVAQHTKGQAQDASITIAPSINTINQKLTKNQKRNINRKKKKREQKQKLCAAAELQKMTISTTYQQSRHIISSTVFEGSASSSADAGDSMLPIRTKFQTTELKAITSANEGSKICQQIVEGSVSFSADAGETILPTPAASTSANEESKICQQMVTTKPLPTSCSADVVETVLPNAFAFEGSKTRHQMNTTKSLPASTYGSASSADTGSYFDLSSVKTYESARSALTGGHCDSSSSASNDCNTPVDQPSQRKYNTKSPTFIRVETPNLEHSWSLFANDELER